MKVAIVYDRANKIGGAERILTALFELYPNAPLFTLVADTQSAPWIKNRRVITSFMQKLPLARRYHEFFPLLPIFAFETFDFSEFDIVISVTSTEAKGIITHPNTLHVCYLLTPTRFIWSNYNDYFQNKFFKAVALPGVILLRLWDQLAANRPDQLVTISKTVARRTLKYYKRNSRVIYPPVDLLTFTPSAKRGDYYLLVSRLVSYKKIDIAISACNKLKLPLIIIGEGLEKNRLVKLAGPTVKFVGNLTDGKLSNYYQNCRALLFPQEEDFGLTAVEALASGKPVFAYRGGAAREIIQEGVTGEFFSDQTGESLASLLEKNDKNTYSWQACRKEAEKYAKNLFLKNFSSFINEAWEGFTIQK